MSKLSELIKIDNRFEKSVNLLLDIDDPKKLDCYIPTRSSVSLLNEFLEETTEVTGNRAVMLVGPYGKGKSHLLLVLLNLIKGQKTKEIKAIKTRIETVSKEAKALMQKVEGRKYLPVIINTSGGSLHYAFMRGLDVALKKEGLEAVIPTNYYSEAVRTIDNWKANYPDTYKQYGSLLKEEGDTLTRNRKALLSYDENALRVFKEIYPRLTSGSAFNPGFEGETLEVFKEVNHILCTENGYAGIYIVFDEFSKYIEGHPIETISTDMAVLQGICELCNNSGMDEQMHLICVAHKSIKAYGDTLAQAVVNAFRGVEGRLSEKLFVISSKNNYELIADAIIKKAAFEKWAAKSKTYRNMLKNSFALPAFSTLFTKTDFQTIIGEGCFPMTPIGAMLLLAVSEKVAQNERTIFTFLTDKSNLSLAHLIRKVPGTDFIGAEHIYDYFEQLFSEDRSVRDIWMAVDYAIRKADTEEEMAILKCLGLILIAGHQEDLPAIETYLQLAAGMDGTAFEQAMNGLNEKGLISKNPIDHTLTFRNRTGIDVEAEIKNCAVRHFQKVDIAAELSGIYGDNYILPKKYNQIFHMTRYFQICFMNPEAYMALSDTQYIETKARPDGFVVLLVKSRKVKVSEIAEHTAENDLSNVLVGMFDKPEQMEEDIRNLLACRYLSKDHDFISENAVLETELKLLEAEYVKRVRNTCDRICKQIKKYLYKDQAIDNGPLGLNRIVSDVCEQIYNLTPVINNEQINRHVLSSQSLKSRNLLFTAMINGEDLEKYMQGTSAESTIYRAVFEHTAGDDNIRLVRGLIDRFIEDSVGKKNCFKEILGVLTSWPYGMRFGVIPLFLLQSLLEKESMPVIYRNNREVLLNSETLNNIILYPDEYYLYVEEKTAEKDRYLKRIEAIFSDYEKFCHDVDARNLIGRITCTIQAWYRSLPQIATTFGVADAPEDDIETVKKFRRLISGINVNPRELLFDRFATLFETDNLDIVVERVSALRNTIDQHLDIVREKEQNLIRECFGIKGNLKLNLLDWYKELPEQTRKTVFSNRTGKLVSYISLIEDATELEIPNEIARIVSGNFIEDWDDQAPEYFRETLLEMLQEIADKESEAGEHIQTIEFHTSEGETKDILYDFDMTNISPAGTFFKNALDDVIEEYADNIEDSEMIGILIDLIKSKAGER